MHHGKRWLYPSGLNIIKARELAAETKSPETVWRLLVARGIDSVEEARLFLKPSLDQLRDPFALSGVREVSDRLIAARNRGELIGIHGDYDVDGLTSTALYTHVLRGLGFKILPFVPHRMIDGYGVSLRALQQFLDQGAKVVLTCDTGFSAVPEVKTAVEEMGLEVLVTDHHLGGDEIPIAQAIVNPNRKNEPYPFKGLCGVGVAFKVLQGLVHTLGEDAEKVLHPYLDLVALGTVCDVMPLVDENRIFVALGVEKLKDTQNIGLRELLKVMKMDEPSKISEMTMGWMIGPRLNAVGRIDDAGVGLQLLLESDPAKARKLAETIDAWNTERKALSKAIEQEAMEMIENWPKPFNETFGIILYAPEEAKAGRPEWHHGVIGIVASKVVERTGRPTFLFAPDEASGAWKGSGRSPAASGAHLKDALDVCARYLAKHGGHAAAAGATLAKTAPLARARFAAAFNEAVKAQVSLDDLVPVVETDGIVGLDEITWEVYRKFFRRFAPFGPMNQEMTFVAQGAFLTQAFAMGQDKTHLRLKLEQHGVAHEGVFWGGRTTHPWIMEQDLPLCVDVVFKVKQNTYRGETRLQLEIIDIRPHGTIDGASSATAAETLAAETASDPTPSDHGHIHPTQLFA